MLVLFEYLINNPQNPNQYLLHKEITLNTIQTNIDNNIRNWVFSNSNTYTFQSNYKHFNEFKSFQVLGHNDLSLQLFLSTKINKSSDYQNN